MAVPELLGAVRSRLAGIRMRWLITGSAGFIGSHVLENLLRLEQSVVSLDNFATGHRSNLDEVRATVGQVAWRRHRFIEGDIRDPLACQIACRDVDVVVHLAALGSVPRSLGDPIGSHETNVTGFLNVLYAAKNAGVRRVVYASSSSVYGDDAALPKVESRVGRPLSPYAVTKCANELYAEVFTRSYGLESIGLRFFNVFGTRQDPKGAYAAVIPRWARAILNGEPVIINGDGETTRDFCYVANAVQAALLAGTTTSREALTRVYNVAVGGRTSLNELYRLLSSLLAEKHGHTRAACPQYGPFRDGDVRHSQADIASAARLLGYAPSHTLEQGLREAVPWYIERFAASRNSVPIASRNMA